ncbi:MAG: CPBP family intramembrane metalloprotease [Coriobacteriia bacterium]|nr:CPBP family intramembrane metalloprotease [Coriobacteriia bacterium]
MSDPGARNTLGEDPLAMKKGPPLKLDPRACDGCGSCLIACDRDALKVGRTFLKVDWQRCNGCGACARACGRKAIVLRKVEGAGSNTIAAQEARPRPVARRSTGAGKGGGRTDGFAQAATGEPDRVVQVPKTGKRGGFQWTLLEAAAMLSVTFSAFTAKETLALWSPIASVPAELEIPARVGVLALYYVIQVAVLVWLVRRRGGEPAAALGLRIAGTTAKHAIQSSGLVVAGLVATRLVASLYAYVTSEMGLMPSTSTDLPALFGSNTSGVILAVVMVVLVGPLVEEAVFRGALLEGLAARLGVWPAIVTQALLFAAFHRSLWLFFPTFVLGAVLGWLAHTRESLWPPIALHALYNAMTVAAAFFVAMAPVG